jgi:hypothetical protein
MHLFRLAQFLFLSAPSAAFVLPVVPCQPPTSLLPRGDGRTALQQSADGGVENQAIEALRSLADFHDGRWQGKARSFAVTADVAAGIVQRQISPVYQSAVKLSLDVANRDFTMTETLEWDDKISSRKVSLQSSNVDVDDVDASFSLDQTLPDLPADLMGTSKLPAFLIEHCLAVSDDRRARCWALYGVDGSLVRVVVSEETRVLSSDVPTSQQEESSSSPMGLTASDLLEMQSDVDRLVDKISGQDSSSSLDVTSTDRMEQLSQRASSGEGDAGANSTTGLSLHPASLLELSSGVWLGDIVIRDHPTIPLTPEQRGKGFGPSDGASSDTRPSSAFAEWSVGVQKIAWRWMWNFGEEIRQINDVGKSMGAELISGLSVSLAGSVCVNEGLSRRIPKEDRMVYIDWGGEDVGFLVGSFAVQLPRYLAFDRALKQKSNGRPFTTEFSVYQSAPSDETMTDDEGAEVAAFPTLMCSKATRVYNYEGSLKQGCTSLFTFKRFGIDKEDV